MSPVDFFDLVASRDSADCGMLLDGMYHLILTEVIHGEKPANARHQQVPPTKTLVTFQFVGDKYLVLLNQFPEHHAAPF